MAPFKIGEREETVIQDRASASLCVKKRPTTITKNVVLIREHINPNTLVYTLLS